METSSAILSSETFYFGVNVPWIRFSEDGTTFSDDVEIAMAFFMDEIVKIGGNVMRWWLHTNGCRSPEFIDQMTVAIRPATILIVKKTLEMARERQLQVIVSLWSFDMLNNQGQDIRAMKLLIEDEVYTNAYIEKALIPLVKEIGNHTALLAWEIFNEPEGMLEGDGWTDERTKIEFIQRAVNLMAAAIHENVPKMLVSNSSYSMETLTDNGGFNFYSDERLFMAGGREKGYLDFYQVHYYPSNVLVPCPFLYPFSFWGLNKPLLISEVSILKGISDKKTRKNLYLITIDTIKQNGYKGCLFWREYMENQDIDFLARTLAV